MTRPRSCGLPGIDGRMGHHRSEPRPQRAASFVAFDLSMLPEIRNQFGRQIGSFWLPQNSPGKAMDETAMRGDQLRPRLLVSPRTRRRKVVIVQAQPAREEAGKDARRRALACKVQHASLEILPGQDEAKPDVGENQCAKTLSFRVIVFEGLHTAPALRDIRLTYCFAR